MEKFLDQTSDLSMLVTDVTEHYCQIMDDHREETEYRVNDFLTETALAMRDLADRLKAKGLDTVNLLDLLAETNAYEDTLLNHMLSLALIGSKAVAPRVDSGPQQADHTASSLAA